MHHALRSRTRTGAAAAVIALALPGAAGLAAPGVAHAQEVPGGDVPAAEAPGAQAPGSQMPANSSLGGLVGGVIPEDVVVGGPDVGTSTERLDALGSSGLADGVLSAGQTLGSVAPLEAVGSTGGSAAASVASSGSLPGSVYANPTGSIGSGVIGFGSVSIPEYFIGSLALQFAGGYLTAMGERQDAGELLPHELTFWHDVVVGSATVGGTLEDAAAASGSALPGSLGGSIDNVQRSALEDPVEAQERRKAEAAAEKAAACAEPDSEEEGCDELEDAAAADGAPADTDARSAADVAADTDDAADAALPGDTAAADAAPAGTLAAVSGPAPTATAPTSDRGVLAATGNDAGLVAGAAALLLFVGGGLVAASRRRA